MAANAAAPFSVCVHVGKEFEWVAQAYGVHRQYKCWVIRSPALLITREILFNRA